MYTKYFTGVSIKTSKLLRLNSKFSFYIGITFKEFSSSSLVNSYTLSIRRFAHRMNANFFVARKVGATIMQSNVVFILFSTTTKKVNFFLFGLAHHHLHLIDLFSFFLISFKLFNWNENEKFKIALCINF